MVDRSLTQERAWWKDIHYTRLYVTIQGVIGGLAGIVHGIYEARRGNVATEGYLLGSIGAFTVLPNYLLTGAAAILVGIALIVWTLGFIHKKHGPTVFILLCILSFLVGGGIAQVLFYLIAWGVATQIEQPLAIWKRLFSGDTGKRLAGLWPAFFVAGYGFLLTGILIWLFLTPPGTVYAEHHMAYWMCWSALVLGLVFQVVTILSGFARDFGLRIAYKGSLTGPNPPWPSVP